MTFEEWKRARHPMRECTTCYECEQQYEEYQAGRESMKASALEVVAQPSQDYYACDCHECDCHERISELEP